MDIVAIGCCLSPDAYVASPFVEKERLVILIPSEVILIMSSPFVLFTYPHSRQCPIRI